VPAFVYELEQAVNDGYLNPPKSMSVPLKFQRHGIKYDDLPEEQQEEHEETFYDEEVGGWPAEIAAGALNKWLFNKDTVNKVLQRLMEAGLKVEGGDRLRQDDHLREEPQACRVHR